MQNTLTVMNGSGLAVRTAFNLAVQATATQFAGATDPATMVPSNAFAYMLWIDTQNNLVKQRNANNDAWVAKGTLLSDGTIQWYEPLSIPIPDDVAQGDIIYRGASGFERLSAGVSGQVLTTNGAGANPEWGAMPIATSAEAIAGTEATKALSPAMLRSGLNASGSAPVFACRAWVNFNGTGTVAIRSSGNVSSITDNGTGNYTVNFTTTMPDANYAALVSISGVSGFTLGAAKTTSNTVSSCNIVMLGFSGGGSMGSGDSDVVEVAIFR